MKWHRMKVKLWKTRKTWMNWKSPWQKIKNQSKEKHHHKQMQSQRHVLDQCYINVHSNQMRKFLVIWFQTHKPTYAHINTFLWGGKGKCFDVWRVDVLSLRGETFQSVKSIMEYITMWSWLQLLYDQSLPKSQMEYFFITRCWNVNSHSFKLWCF